MSILRLYELLLNSSVRVHKGTERRRDERARNMDMNTPRALLTTTILVSFAFAVNVAFSAAEVSHYDDVIENARELWREGRREEAVKEADRIIKELTAFIKEDPANSKVPNAMLNMALVYGVYGKDEFGKAEEVFKEIITRHPDHELMPAVKYYYGKNIAIGFGSQRNDEAMKIFEEVVRKYPKSDFAPRARIEKANWFRHLSERDPEKLKEAISIYESIVSRYPKSVSAAESAHVLTMLYLLRLDLGSTRIWLEKLSRLSHPLASELHADTHPIFVAYDIYLNEKDLNRAKRSITATLKKLRDSKSREKFIDSIVNINGRVESDKRRCI